MLARMEPDFWRERWRAGEIGFHRADVNAHLRAHRDALFVVPRPRVLVPLCGKSVDLAYLAAEGADVVGVELVEDAAVAFFAERGWTPAVTRSAARASYAAHGVEIVAGDLFAEDAQSLGTFDAIWDRAALVALPPALRARYAPHLTALARPGARLLCVTFVFDGPPVGPPHSVPDDEVRAHFGDAFALTRLAALDILDESPRFRERGVTTLEEHVWLGVKS
jgi:thiopurine S-methyltransferase